MPLRLLRDGFDWAGRTGRAGAGAVALAVGALAASLALGPRLVEGWSRAHEAAVVLPLALLAVPAAGHAVRRLTDMGWRGWWAWALIVPGAGLAALALLLAMPPAQRRPRASLRLRALGMAAAAGGGLLLLGSLGWTALPVRAQDMKPGLLPGDVVLVRRGAGGLSRGDVVAFRPPSGPARLGRLVAVGGERVAMEAGVPVIDGAPARQAPDGLWTETFARQGPDAVLPLCGNGAVGFGGACTTRRLSETLPGAEAHAVLDLGARALDTVAEAVVPAGHVFLLGDHRDAGLDGRAPVRAGGAGMVPLAAVLGRADRVLASSSARAAWDPRGWRPARTLMAVR